MLRGPPLSMAHVEARLQGWGVCYDSGIEFDMEKVMSNGSRDWAVDLRRVDKRYAGRGGVHALRDVELRVRRGAVFGLLGPNGAGKSTLVKIMMTIVRPTVAEGTVLGRAVGEKETLRRRGVFAGAPSFPALSDRPADAGVFCGGSRGWIGRRGSGGRGSCWSWWG